MAQLAIKGHPGRGKEVIEILEMMEGYNANNCSGKYCDRAYYINENGYIDQDFISHVERNTKFIIFSLEEFLEKFPYKVGDKVHHIIDNENQIITDLIWDGDEDEVLYKTTNNFGYVYVNYLQPYKEETTNKAIFETNAQCCDIMNNIIKKYMKEIKIDIPEGYEFFGVDDDNKIVLTEKQPQYPKTYKECFNICFGNKHHIVQVVGLDDLGDNKELFESFIKLKICRDAYWKIAVEEKKGDIDYVICNVGGKIISTNIPNSAYNHILSFPTEEMRDAFYENFKELINDCKELL